MDVEFWKMFVLGLGATVLFFAALWPLKGTFARDLFIGRDQLFWDRVVFQGLIMLMWMLSLSNIVLKMLKIRAEKAVLDDDLVPEQLNFEDAEKVRSVFERIEAHPQFTESVTLTRLGRVLAMWINTQDFGRTSQLAKEEADLDAFASDASYRLNRLFIWALPVLGFIGTVYGVSLAVSGFASFLSAANVTPDAIKTEVGNITTGLGVAFYTTLLGLVGATGAAFPSLVMERSEEGMLEGINEFVEDRLVSHMPTAAEKEFPLEKMVNAIREGMEGIQANLKFPVDELAQAIDAGFRRLPNPDRYEEVFTRAITKAGDLINEKYSQFQTHYEQRVSELGSQLGGKIELVANQFNTGSQRMMAEFGKSQERNLELYSRNEQKLNDRFDELTSQITSLGKDLTDQFGEAHGKYVDAVEELSKKEMARYEKMVSEFSSLSAKLAESFRQAVASMDAATTRYSERLQSAAEDLSRQLEKVSQIGVEIDKVLRTTQSLETAMRQVGGSDEFRQTLANLRNHLTSSDELLKQLSRPRKVVFQEARVDDSL
jgi:hypothetical protein